MEGGAGSAQSAQDKKRKREEKNKRRQQKKRARVAKAYGLGGGGGSRRKDPRSVTAAGSSSSLSSSSSSSSAAAAADASLPTNAKLHEIFQEQTDLAVAGDKALAWLVSPVESKTFLRDYYEKKPLLVRRAGEQPGYFDGLLSKKAIRALLAKGKLRHTRDFSLTQYRDGLRKTLLGDATHVALAKQVMELFSGPEQCSVRLLRPHNHSPQLWKLISCLEAFWGCGGGSNAYLTPRGSQGFAPHYDDIDAFVLQLEGRKSWTVYKHYEHKPKPKPKPKSGKSNKGKNSTKTKKGRSGDGESESESESDDSDVADFEMEWETKNLFPRMPLSSSEDFTEEQVGRLEVALTATLGPGDMLYIPRGMVHQARADPKADSLHVTVSSAQHNSWADLVALALTHAVDKACRNDKAHDCAPLRQNLPRDLYSYMGVVHSDFENKDARRLALADKVVQLVSDHVLPSMDLDVIADQLAAKFQFDRHKPLGVLAKLRSSEGEGLHNDVVDDDASAEADHDGDDETGGLTLDTTVVLAAKGVATLTVEGDSAILYHSCKNTTTWHEAGERGLEFEQEDAVAIEPILNSDPTQPFALRTIEHPTGTADLLRVAKFLVAEKIVKVVD